MLFKLLHGDSNCGSKDKSFQINLDVNRNPRTREAARPYRRSRANHGRECLDSRILELPGMVSAVHSRVLTLSGKPR